MIANFVAAPFIIAAAITIGLVGVYLAERRWPDRDEDQW